ncbi:MAG TPA: hypothetical protein VHE30_18280, partial [Polyangiaceae bacterium]|nr:hypothetical protein [Polyangiaceae bacterium]
MRRSLAVLVGIAGLFVHSPGRAERIRAHGGLGLAKAVGGYQGRELGFGVAGYAAGEMPLAPQLGAEV